MVEINQEMLTEIKSWVLQAGKIALSKQSKVKMHLKEDNSPVTDAEFEIENLIIEKIKKNFPGHAIISEEQAMVGDNRESVWALDPVDGTKTFLAQLPVWGISLGLIQNGKPEAGFFYLPATQEMYYAWEKGAFWQDQPLKPLSTMPYKDPLLFLGVPSNAHRDYEINYPRVRAMGSTTAHLAYICRGISIGSITRRVSIWDIASILPFFNHLGIRSEYYSGAPLEIKDILNKELIPEPILSAPQQWFDKLRRNIQPKKAG